MSESSPDLTEPEASAEPSPSEPETWTFIALIGDDTKEPSAHLTDHDALSAWAAVSAPWHPRLLRLTKTLPRIESVDTPSLPGPREVRLVAAGASDQLPAEDRGQAETPGTIRLDAGTKRHDLIRQILERLGVPHPALDEADPLAKVANDFLALGTAHWWLRDLAIAMGHADGLDVESLTREVLSGAQAWCDGDHAAATNRLRAGFECLTQARERFYPMDAYIVDICLVDPSTPAGALNDALDAHAAVTFLAPAQAIDNLAQIDPDAIARLRESITEGWADVVGGSYAEVDEPLLPFESIIWQFRYGGTLLRRHLEDRNVETVARRRFALYPRLPQIVKRFGYRFAVHLAFDAGRFPIRPEAKRLWESPDGSTLETLTRPPIAADRPAQGLRVPWRLAQSMRDDHVATLPLVHWPNQVAPWYRDMRRVAGYSPVLARWVTLNDYFHLTDRPYDTFRPEPDDYITPYLAQAVARNDDRPISRRVDHHALRARLDAASGLRALALAVSSRTRPQPEGIPSLEDAETALETARFDEATAAIQQHEQFWSDSLAQAINGEATGGRAGYLVFNPLGIPRRAAVVLPEAALDLRPEPPLRASQFTEDGVLAVVDLAPFGYAWVPREANLALPPGALSGLSARDRILRNDAVTVEIDGTTGGIRGIKGPNEGTARLGQQLVVLGAEDSEGKPIAAKMVLESFEVDYGGPALVQARSLGAIVDPATNRRLAAFEQRYRLWNGRPILEIDVTLKDIDPDWLARAGKSDPWNHAIACRWAWPDPNSMLRRTCVLAPELTEADRPETPDAFEISTRRQRTSMLFGGLAHHRRNGSRMLDTLLVAGRETSRTFRLGVILDHDHPFAASADLIGPAYVVPTDAGPPATGVNGWLFQVDNKAIAVTRVEFVDSSGDGRGWGVALHMQETTGHAARCRLRTFRNPIWARQTDFHNELIVDLPIEEDAVHIDFTPYEVARVDITLG